MFGAGHAVQFDLTRSAGPAPRCAGVAGRRLFPVPAAIDVTVRRADFIACWTQEPLSAV